MSGIAGIIHFDGAPADRGLIRQMTAAMPYRGPDGINHWVKGSVALGQCMLCTTPESLEETQPWSNEDESLVLVMDGRVDNWEELRKELLGRGARLRNRSDAELVLRAYEIWGDDCLEHIDGDFALALWNARERTVYCARDRIGNKPFHHYWDGKRFVFASELHTILALPWVKEVLNEGMVAEYLAGEWYSRDETLWLDVKRLIPSHRMKVDSSGPKLHRYWRPDLTSMLSYKKEEDYIEHYREVFTDVIRRKSRSYVPIACDVSGGLDSSAIFAVAQHLKKNGLLQSPSIDGYTLDFHNDSRANELDYVRAVGKYWGKRIREVKPSLMPNTWYQEWVQRYREFPSYPNGVMSLSMLSEAASRGSRVHLGGVGGDQWIAGDRTYYADLLANREWQTLMKILKRDTKETGFSRSLWWLMRYGLLYLSPDSAIKGMKNARMLIFNQSANRHSWLKAALKSDLKKRRNLYYASENLQGLSPGLRLHIQKLNRASETLGLELQERTMASVGMELRRPFWDARMIQFIFSVPSQCNLKGNTDKALHRSAMKGLLPELVLSRDSKAEFSIAFKANMEELREEFSKETLVKQSTWIDPKVIRQLWQDYDNDHLESWPYMRLWGLFWCDRLAVTAKNY